MRKTLSVLAVLCLLVTFMASCASNPLVGKWSVDTGAVAVTAEFKTDGTYAVATSSGIVQVTVSEGTYKVNGNKLSLNDGSETEFSIQNNKLYVTLAGFGALVLDRQ